jgi:LysM repeat protein
MDISQYYMFRSSAGKSVVVRRGMGAPVITGGGGRWKTINRPRRTSIVQWDGDDPYTIDVPVLFDGWANNDSIEEEIAILNQMKMADKAENLTPPPTVFVDGALPVKGARWVIADITWDADNVIWHVVGDKDFRYRQSATVHLLQYVPTDTLVFKKVSVGSTIHTVKSGETLRSIAKKHTGNANDAKAIAKANGIRDHKTIKTGQNLKIPKPTRPSVNRAEGTSIR